MVIWSLEDGIVVRNGGRNGRSKKQSARKRIKDHKLLLNDCVWWPEMRWLGYSRWNTAESLPSFRNIYPLKMMILVDEIYLYRFGLFFFGIFHVRHWRFWLHHCPHTGFDNKPFSYNSAFSLVFCADCFVISINSGNLLTWCRILTFHKFGKFTLPFGIFRLYCNSILFWKLAQ